MWETMFHTHTIQKAKLEFCTSLSVHSVHSLYVLEQKTGKQKILYRMIASIPLMSSWIEFWFVKFVPKYFNCSALSNELLSAFIPTLNFSYTYFDRNDYLQGYQQPQMWTHQRLYNNNHKIKNFVIERASKYLFIYLYKFVIENLKWNSERHENKLAYFKMKPNLQLLLLSVRISLLDHYRQCYEIAKTKVTYNHCTLCILQATSVKCVEVQSPIAKTMPGD